MSLFGKKKSKKESAAHKDSAEEMNFDIQTMPGIFYGGKDPEIYHDEFAKKEMTPSMHTQEVKKEAPPQLNAAVHTKPSMPAAPKKPAPQQSPVSAVPKKKHHYVLILFFLAVIILAGVSWYYLSDSLQNLRGANNDQTPPAPVFNDDTPPTSSSPSVVTNPTTSNPSVTTTTTNGPSAVLTFPRTTFSQAVDIDSDELTDREEEIFGTDSGTWDSDDDGYYDGQEVANLYNPAGFAPRRLIDSGLVREYINPAFQYRLYYPIGWDVASVDPRSEQVLISAITGDYIEVRSFELGSQSNFTQWFSQYARGQQFSDLQAIENRFEINGYVRRDGLVAYFFTNTHVFVLLYNPGTAEQITYPHIMNMTIQSFRPNRTTTEIPDQVIIPTSTPVSTSTSAASTSSVADSSSTTSSSQ